MKKAVIIRFRRDAEMASGAVYHKGAEFELPSPDVAHNLYGDAIEILRYADGEDYELNLREQAVERKELAEDEDKERHDAAMYEATSRRPSRPPLNSKEGTEAHIAAAEEKAATKGAKPS